MNQTKLAIGRIGEELITNLLPGAINVASKRLPYDIIWNDIRIDVKTTTLLSLRNKARFNIMPTSANDGVVLVMVALTESYTYYWVDRYSDRVTISRSTNTAIDKEDLQSAVIAAHELNIDPITKIKNTTTINLDVLDNQWIKGQQFTMAKKLKRRANMSQADVIHELRVFYEEAQKVMAK